MNTKTHVNNPVGRINPVFYPVWLSKKNHILLKGGRSSTKSSVVSEKLVQKKMKYPMSNVIALRQVANTLQKSVYSQITWALHQNGVADQFKFMKNPLQIIHKEWGTGFHFSGADDPEKLKSLKIPVGFVSDVWFEEMDSFDSEEAIDKIEDTFIRNDLPHGLEVTVWGSWNPPRNPYSWINDYVDKHRNDDDFLIHHSTYLDDKLGYNSNQIIKKIEKYKLNDNDYYRWMYLGEVIGMGDNVYNMNLFKPITELFDDDRIIYLYYAIDGGHMVSATTALCFGLTAKGKVILLGTYYYSPAGKTIKKAPDDLAKDINEFIKRTSRDSRWSSASIRRRTIDSAEGGIRNQYFKDYGQRLSPVAKKKKPVMIDYVHDLLAQGRFYYLDIEENKIFVEEHKMYRWDEKSIKKNNPEVIKEDDHTCDAFQYFAVDNARDLKLKV